MKEEMQEIEKQNNILKTAYCDYEESLRSLPKKKKNTEWEDKVENKLGQSKLEELRNAWKQEQEEEKVKFSEAVRKQIQDKTKDTVIQVVKEKEDLVRDTVDKRKRIVQDSTQELDQEVEEVIRLESFSEGEKRPMKVRMRSQVVMEEIMTRKGKLADDTEFKDIWMKRDMNLEEREREKLCDICLYSTDPNNPNRVLVRKLVLLAEGQSEKELDLTGDLNALKDEAFTIKDLLAGIERGIDIENEFLDR
ncbi:hypothetical protein E2C01_021058 [Portunus trituberculatus]|uniref:Uncharacterized protein n=1 Tax=Portunus trituberculatus TaxID=210409 RepID=A0A5B7E1Q5_PORTR|nr:hypothetical protein [Portunus trituberculatus]